MTLQPPAPVIDTTSPATEQPPVALKRTASPDDAVAVTVNGGSPNVRSGSAAKVIVWPAAAMANARATSGAGS